MVSETIDHEALLTQSPFEFDSCAFVPVSINSVLESLIMSFSLIIQLRISQTHASIAAMAAS